MRHMLFCAVLISFPVIVQAQATKPARKARPVQSGSAAQVSAEKTEPVEPASCVQFDEMASRVDALITDEDISEDEFNQAARTPGAVVRNPGKVFDVGNVQYIATGGSEKLTFKKFTPHEDKKTEFLKWYSAGGNMKMFFLGMACIVNYNTQMRASNTPPPLSLQLEMLKVYSAQS